jgi:hypothetical protein
MVVSAAEPAGPALVARALTPSPITPKIADPEPPREALPTPATGPIPPVAPTLASSAYVSPRERLSAIRETTSRREAPLATPVARPVSSSNAPSSIPTSTGSGRQSPAPAPALVMTPKKTRTIAWMPRPLPAHVRGKCHVRGSVPRAARRWIERSYGREACDDVLRAVPPQLADSYRTDAFNALVWYDLEALDTFLEGATALVLGGDATAWRLLARESFEADFGQIFRAATRGGDPAALLKRSTATWSRLYDFANVRVGEPSRPTGLAAGANAGPARVTLRFEGFEGASLALRNVTLGAAEGLVRSSGARDATARVLAGEASFLRDFEIEIAWSATTPP